MRYPDTFDVIVVGGGHAGTEAALAAARSGARTLLVTHQIESIGQMSCNPAIGGIGKGHLVREIDALGGIMARAADAAGIQWRLLNARKGPAVRATRCQADRTLYRNAIRQAVDAQENLTVFQQPVDDLIIDRKSTRLNSSHVAISYAVFCLKKKKPVGMGDRSEPGGLGHARVVRRAPRERPGAPSKSSREDATVVER